MIRQEQRAVPLRPWIANVQEGLLTPREFDAAHDRWEKQQPKRKAPAPRGRGERGGRDARDNQTTHLDIFGMLREADLLPCLYFAFSRKATEQYARALGRKLAGPQR